MKFKFLKKNITPNKMTLTTIVLLVLIGLAAGTLSGVLGIGGGVIMVPLLLLLGFSQHQAQGTSLAAMLPPVTLLAALAYAKEGHVDWKMALVISAAFIIGGLFGSKIATAIDEKMLRKIFGVLMLIISIKMIFGK
ncbi:sulfite exporter TauE/SafE family protein [Pseudofulvibacter geojedonensis]